MSSRDHLFKVLVVGDAAVGKTSLVQRYSQDSFSKHYKSTVGGKTPRVHPDPSGSRWTRKWVGSMSSGPFSGLEVGVWD
jgi:GTPase SAR1 family protein